MFEELVAGIRACVQEDKRQMPVLLLLDCPAQANTHRKAPRKTKMADIMRDMLRGGLLELDLPAAHSEHDVCWIALISLVSSSVR